jgi:hypothetical protein
MGYKGSGYEPDHDQNGAVFAHSKAGLVLRFFTFVVYLFIFTHW